MPKTLRLKIAREYLNELESSGDRKNALLKISKAYGRITPRSIMNYVAELRGKR